MAIEQHVLDEVGRQLDYYVDAYRKVHDLDVQMAGLTERIEALSQERMEAERLRDMASEQVNELVGNIPEEDEPIIKALTEEKLSSLIGLMVL